LQHTAWQILGINDKRCIEQIQLDPTRSTPPMARISPNVLRRYLLAGKVPVGGCLRHIKTVGLGAVSGSRGYTTTRAQQTHTETVHSEFLPTKGFPAVPLRKQLKDEAKKRKAENRGGKSKKSNQKLDDWELTVGIEIHAQLNTERKLFSAASSTINDIPNTRVALFDVAMPGSQPTFQKETLIPALRAAMALNCNIQKTSRFDRKHYFHWDQPSGYQITQYYEPFAKDGYITLYAHDGIAEADGEKIKIGIKQIQMEQDTAKTMSEPDGLHLLDFNRVGLPLIEIITLPQIHHPSTAAALVRKIQILLSSVDACVLGMQSGGLRADVNVSVRRRDADGSHEYSGVKGLGQRTEIKNLSSFKAVEDAIIAERDRQIEVLEAGGVIEGETRGWTIGSTQTKRLRGKEGEVDYRYMPDPDLGPVIIGQDVLDHIGATLGILPDQELDILVEQYGLSVKDAMSLVALNDGQRVEYFYKVVDELLKLSNDNDSKKTGKMVGNWVLHEMGGLNSPYADEDNPLGMSEDGDCLIPSTELARLLYFLDLNKITGNTAKKVLAQLYTNLVTPSSSMGDRVSINELGLVTEEETSWKSVEEIIEKTGLWFRPFSAAEYDELASSVLDQNTKTVEEILAGKQGKINFLLGQMMRQNTEGRLDAQEAMKVLKRLVDERKK
jgi:aspartyl-tRNA(Asn)/glutamyl-tRNA(Gln) amidotransferase subunit B